MKRLLLILFLLLFSARADAVFLTSLNECTETDSGIGAGDGGYINCEVIEAANSTAANGNYFYLRANEASQASVGCADIGDASGSLSFIDTTSSATDTFTLCHGTNEAIVFSNSGTEIKDSMEVTTTGAANDPRLKLESLSHAWTLYTDEDATGKLVWESAGSGAVASMTSTGNFETRHVYQADGFFTTPQAADCSATTQEGRLCWDTDDNILYAGNGAAVQAIGGAGMGDVVGPGPTVQNNAITRWDGTGGYTIKQIANWTIDDDGAIVGTPSSSVTTEMQINSSGGTTILALNNTNAAGISGITLLDSDGVTYSSITHDNGTNALDFRPSAQPQVLSLKDTEAIVNELGIATTDFRVESDNNTFQLFVDAGDECVGVNMDCDGTADLMVTADTANMGLKVFGNGTNQVAAITNETGLDGLHVLDASVLLTTDGDKYVLNSHPGGIWVNENGDAALDFRVRAGANNYQLYVDSGLECTGVNVQCDGLSDLQVTADTGNIGLKVLGNGTSAVASLMDPTGNDGMLVLDDGVLITQGGGLWALDVGSFGTSLNENGEPGLDFRVGSDTNTAQLFVDAGNECVGINDSACSASELEVTADTGNVGISVAGNGTQTALIVTQGGTGPSTGVAVTHTSTATGAVAINAGNFKAKVTTDCAAGAGTCVITGLLAQAESETDGDAEILQAVSAAVTMNSTGDVVTDARGVHVAVDIVGGTITNGYGIYIADIAGTNDYGIWQAGADDDNYFAGPILLSGTVTIDAHIIATGTVSTVNTGGCTTPAITANSTDVAGEVNVGTSCATGTITIDINKDGAWTTAPFCTVSFSSGTPQALKGVPSTTALVITATANFADSDKITWHCIGSS